MRSRASATPRDPGLRQWVAEFERLLPAAPFETLAATLADLDRLRTLLWTRWLQATVTPERGQAPPSADRLFGVAEAAELLGISRTVVRRLERNGTLPAVRIGRRLLFRRDVLGQFAEDHERERSNVV